MKNLTKVLGLLALSLVLAFSMTACDDGDGGSGGSATLGDKLELKGQVYTVDYDFSNLENVKVVYEKFEGNLTINCSLGGEGKVEDGKLAYSIETPTSLSNISYLKEAFDDDWDDVTITPSTAKYAMVVLSVQGGGTIYYDIMSVKGNEANGSGKEETVTYIYVDKDVAMSGKGTSDEYIDEDYDLIKTTTRDFSFNLKEGWNAIKTEEAISQKLNDDTLVIDTTIKVSLSNPSLKWVYYNNW